MYLSKPKKLTLYSFVQTMIYLTTIPVIAVVHFLAQPSDLSYLGITLSGGQSSYDVCGSFHSVK